MKFLYLGMSVLFAVFGLLSVIDHDRVGWFYGMSLWALMMIAAEIRTLNESTR
ncbi:MAG: hypothetical protein KAS32_14805 [Candidatus Peribacteraceae bacterium]|nr:hypothetical protein [Candidatus Peribacteraceae bacterium]